MKYIIMGEPVSQARARATILKGKIVLYDPPKSKAYKKTIREQLLSGYLPRPSERPLKLILDIYVSIPKSYTKKRRESILKGEELPAKKPDVSNFLKLVEDACNGILYKDDNLIVEVQAKKHYSEEPRIEIEVIEL